MSVLVVGSVALDSIETPFGKCQDILGGSATFSSISANFFSRVNLVAVVGQDFPKKYIELLKNKSIDLKGLIIEKGETFRWAGKYGWDFADPQTLATHLNVFATFNPILPKEYCKSKYVFLANIDPEIQKNVLRQITKPKLVVCDTMNYWINNKRKELVSLLKHIDVFLLNESEARHLSGETNILKAARAIFKLGPKRIIIKKGEHGALLFSKKSVFCVPAFLLESIYDPTGAGDTFAGAFIGYLAKTNKITEDNLRKAVVYGNIVATFAVEDFSLNRLTAITKADIEYRFQEFKKIVSF